jgi:hypothetical protein
MQHIPALGLPERSCHLQQPHQRLPHQHHPHTTGHPQYLYRTKPHLHFLRVQSHLAAAKVVATTGAQPAPDTACTPPLQDNICTRGIRTTAGSQLLSNYTPPYNATAVSRLLSAGALCLGKTNCDEFGMGSTTENSAYMVRAPPCPCPAACMLRPPVTALHCFARL